MFEVHYWERGILHYIGLHLGYTYMYIYPIYPDGKYHFNKKERVPCRYSIQVASFIIHTCYCIAFLANTRINGLGVLRRMQMVVV